MSCLVAVVDLNNELEVSKLIDIMHELQIDHKHLTVIMDTLNTSLLHEKSINFNVIINHRGEGNYHNHSLLGNIQLVSSVFADGSWVTTSLCPTLGKKYAQEYSGLCLSHFQEPHGKTLNISFIGSPPHITYNPMGGSEFIITTLLAKKFKFIPKYIPARTYDTFEDSNGKTLGMVNLVSNDCNKSNKL